MLRSFVLALALAWLVASPALADSVINAKADCQVVYGSGTESDNACEHGVDLAGAESPNEATRQCARVAAAENIDACRRGVALHTRRTGDERASGKSDFSHAWKPGRGAADVDIGDYRVHLGDAEKSMDDCLRSYDGSSRAPSCLSGLSVQHKPTTDAPPK